MWANTEKIRSKMWQRGRKERTSSESNMGLSVVMARPIQQTFVWVSMAPLGGPVVPEV